MVSQPMAGFNPRPREGATGAIGLCHDRDTVSIHAPVKGRRDSYTYADGAPIVSIHAPVKGRPWKELAKVIAEFVSIHAPVKGRLEGNPAMLIWLGFQSTPP